MENHTSLSRESPPGANTEPEYASLVPEVTEPAVTTYAVIPFLATCVPIVAKCHPAVTTNPHDSYTPNREKLPFWQLHGQKLTLYALSPVTK